MVLLDDGTERLVSEAKTPYQRRLPLTGGVNWIPANAGPVLTAAEKQQLRELIGDVQNRLAASVDNEGKPMPWDIEFGFVAGELTLFQIRPLVERGQARADRAVRQLLPTSTQSTLQSNKSISLNAPLGQVGTL